MYAIEIEMSSDTIKNNIEKDFENAKCDFLIIACRDEKTLKKGKEILTEFQNSTKKRTNIVLIKDLIKFSSSDII